MVGKRAQLSRELITTTALDVVARDGLDALSMRRLAQELDVWPMSVYRHFRDKDDLLDAVAAAGTDDVQLPARRGNASKQLAALAAHARDLLERQPRDLRPRALSSQAMLGVREAALATLTEAGLSPDEAAPAWRAVLAYVIGSIELDAAGDGSEPEFHEGLERILGGTIRA